MNKLSIQSENNNKLSLQVTPLKIEIAKAMKITNSKELDISHTAECILKRFQKTPIEAITKALEEGSFGEYGKTFKLSTQEICIWIKEYLKTHTVVSVEEYTKNPYTS